MMHLYSKQPFFERDQMLLSFPESLLQTKPPSITGDESASIKFSNSEVPSLYEIGPSQIEKPLPISKTPILPLSNVA